ncbi:ATPase, partial [Reticulomyxa filosa]
MEKKTCIQQTEVRPKENMEWTRPDRNSVDGKATKEQKNPQPRKPLSINVKAPLPSSQSKLSQQGQALNGASLSPCVSQKLTEPKTPQSTSHRASQMSNGVLTQQMHHHRTYSDNGNDGTTGLSLKAIVTPVKNMEEELNHFFGSGEDGDDHDDNDNDNEEGEDDNDDDDDDDDDDDNDNNEEEEQHSDHVQTSSREMPVRDITLDDVDDDDDDDDDRTSDSDTPPF